MTDQTEPPTEPAVYEGVPTSARDNFLIDWGLDTWRKSAERLADALQRVVTLNVTLLGGSLVFLREEVAPAWARLAAMGAFLLSLALALAGSLPRTARLDPEDPDAVLAYKSRVADAREWWLRGATWALWAGLAVAVAGVAARAGR